ncbi:hypothetical protein LKL35_35020 [Streptomyces sp. ET3-23]|uniref:hypothetical protein n=1 Tax=Streptomyces sp. ET3-23 TaxID=2885643 RepID=UPI001D127CA9|nr:hypothetical protein [Streptomyces sp. ET3-23]MCC2280579.1 hypothetical protein [Streptomyces sp. ET3-23]
MIPQPHLISHPYGRAVRPRESPMPVPRDWPKDLQPLVQGRRRGVAVTARLRAEPATTTP